jgi:uncharacterized protein YndB with AHSA1/START domain
MTEATSERTSPHERMEFSQPSDVENRVSRIFRAPRERVFHLFTDRETLPYVFARDPKTVTIEKLEFRKGGHYSVSTRQDDGKVIRLIGEFLEVDPPRRVVNTWSVESSPGGQAIETDEFEAVGDFTRVTVTWKFQKHEDRDKMYGPEMMEAMTAMWDNFAELAEKGTHPAARARA